MVHAETYHRVVDPFTGQVTEIEHEAFERVNEAFFKRGIVLQRQADTQGLQTGFRDWRDGA